MEHGHSEFQIRIDAAKIEADTEEAAAVQAGFTVHHRAKIKTPEDPFASAGFLEPVSLTITITVSYLVSRIVNHWLRSKERGTLIDLRERPPYISRIAAVPAGFVVIVDKNGNSTRHKYQYDKPEALAPLLKQTLSLAATGGN
ncbi:MAG TPA: hypothetical protein VFP86_17900 [bacterium]|nr:hypothetical protein [bacterium]